MADTSYAIDIEADAGGVTAAAKACESLASGLVTAGASASQLSSQLATARTALDSAATASAYAAEAVKAGEASYAANEVAAERAAKAADKLAQQVAAARARVAELAGADGGPPTAGYEKAAAALARLESKQAEAATRAGELASALEAEGAALDALKASATAAEAEHAKLAAGVEQLEAASKKAADEQQKLAEAAAGSGKLKDFGEGIGKIGGPLGAFGQKAVGAADGVKKMLAAVGTGPGLMLGLAVAVVAVVAALAAGTVALVKWGIGLANANRDAKLSTEALSRTSDALRDIGPTMDAVGKKTGLAGEELAGLAKQLDGAGVKAADMPAALEAVAIAEQALGKGAAGKLVEDLKAGKKTAGELAAEMRSKFGDIVAKKMLSLDASAAKLKSNLSETFGGLNIEGLLGGLSKAADWLSTNHSLGRALKWVFESLFQPLVDAAAAAIPKVERFLLGVAIGALKVYIALKPAIKAVGELFGSTSTELPDALELGKAAGAALGSVLAAVAGIILTVVSAVQGMISGFQAAWAIGSAAFSGIAAAVSTALDAVSNISLRDVGMAIIKGLVEGLLGGVGGVVSAMLSIGDSAISALKSKLSIHSPSRVFEGLGGFTAEGFARGVEDGADDAQGAVEDMVRVPDAPSASSTSAGAPSFSGATFNFYGVESPQKAAEMVREALVDLFSGGATPAPAGA